MKKFLFAALALLLAWSPAQAQKTKSQLSTEINANFPDNTTGLITPQILRTTTMDIVNSVQQFAGVNAQVGTTYTIGLADYGQLVTFNNSGSIAVALPQATGSFATFNFFVRNLGAGTVTITPTTSTINGASTLSVPSTQGYWIVSDGTNYQIWTVGGSGSGLTSVGLTLPGIFSVANSPLTTNGTISASLVNQSANTFWAGPSSPGSATPTFRSLANADLPFTLPLSLSNGGSNNSGLVASNGGIVYSDATKLNILAGTATAGKIPRSGSNTAPAWSTATYPDTAGTAGNVLRSDGTNLLSATLAAADLSNGVTGSGTVVLSAAPTISGIATFSGVTKFTTQSAPAQITSDQNNYNPGSVVCSTSGTLLINSDAARNITGIAGGVAGCELRIINDGSFSITLKDSSGSSTAANQFAFGGDLVIASNGGAKLLYDGVNSRWRQLFVGTTSGGSGTVTSVTCNGLAITTSGTCPEAFGFTNCSLTASAGPTLLTVALKDASGADPTASSPCRITFRSATASTGSWTSNSVTAALSINTNAAGATLGSSSTTAFRFWVVAFDNSGTTVLALYNASNATRIFPLNESVVQSSVAMSGTATSAGVFYTPNGTTVSSKAFRILGYVEYNSAGLTVAGTYASAPNFVQIFGPGIKKPGEIVQTNQMSHTTAATTTATTPFTTTASTLAITPTSAVNLIKFYHYDNMCFGNTIDGLYLAVFRGAQELSAGAVNVYFGAAGAVVSNRGYDKPNSSSATTYTVEFKNNGVNSQTVYFNYAAGTQQAPASLILEEVQG